MLKYSDERNAQIVIALLKAKGIRYVVASPGSTNGAFVGSVQNDPFFTVYSCIDERSAAYMACGIASSSGEAVVLSCTGATSSRNYMPALTEAYYRKLPVLAVTSMSSVDGVGNLITQVIDRSVRPKDISLESVSIDPVLSDADAKKAELKANRAMEALFRNGGGPSHIQLITLSLGTLETQELPEVHNMSVMPVSRIEEWPVLKEGLRLIVYLGAEGAYSACEIAAIEHFAESRGAVVLSNITSGYRGRLAINGSLAGLQLKDNPVRYDLEPDLVIHVGEMSGNYDTLLFMNDLSCDVWRVSLDGELRQSFGHLRYVFQSDKETFFDHYTNSSAADSSFREAWETYTRKLEEDCPELPFSNIWIARQMSNALPSNSLYQPSILSSLSASNFSLPSGGVETAANVGGFGIDGCVSTLIGASFVNPGKLCVSLVGDLAFFYDVNCLGNRHIGPNVRIVLVNNNKGMTFKHADHYGSRWGAAADPYLAAAGHFLSKGEAAEREVSPAQAWVESLGFKYLRAQNKRQFSECIEQFLDSESPRPILLECFTNEDDEREARNLLCSIDKRKTTKGKMKHVAKIVLPQSTVSAAKKMLGR